MVGLIGSIINGFTSYANTENTNLNNRRMQEKANEANIAMNDATNKTNLDINAATNAANERIAQGVNQTNRDIADQNLGFQRENLEYQKALQQQIFEREDSAYQRTVSDMRAAGLSPLSMQNTNGAGEAIATNALNNSFQAQTGAPMQSATMRPGEVKAAQYQTADLGLGSLAASLDQFEHDMFQRDSLRSQARKAEAEAEAQEIENKFKFALTYEKMRQMGIQSDAMENELRNAFKDTAYKDFYGITDSMSPELVKANILAKSMGLSPMVFSEPFRALDSHGSYSDWNHLESKDWFGYNSYYHDRDGSYPSRSSAGSGNVGAVLLGLQIASGLGSILGGKGINIGDKNFNNFTEIQKQFQRFYKGQ